MDKISHLRREIAQREAELADLRSQLAVAESQERTTEHDEWKWPLGSDEYQRYSRQMIVPKFGLQGIISPGFPPRRPFTTHTIAGQLKLKKARVLLVGAGGLGCPAAAYLAGAGVGELGLVDGDTVEMSNLHRQIAHSAGRVGMSKVQSAIAYLKELNPSVTYHAHQSHLTTQNARDIVERYDLVLDCTDHPTSRYLISDICALLSKPLVSASAFQASGQLITLNDPPGEGPCYRCVFPKPPPPESVVGCGEGGILGPVVGIMGVLQALEAIKLITREEPKDGPPMMLLFSAMGDVPFRSVKMRGRRKGCFACSDGASLTLETMQSSMDYVQFCGVNAPVNILAPEERVTADEYDGLSRQNKDHVLLDVREKEHFDLCNLEGSINVPISRFMSHRGPSGEAPDWLPADIPPEAPIYVVCRVGNDSQIATQKMKEMGLDRDGERFIGDIRGGLKAWKDTIDPSIPLT